MVKDLPEPASPQQMRHALKPWQERSKERHTQGHTAADPPATPSNRVAQFGDASNLDGRGRQGSPDELIDAFGGAILAEDVIWREDFKAAQ